MASKIEFEEDITKLIPSTTENSEAQKVLKNVNFTDKIIVNITKSPDASVDDLTQYASQFIDSISQNSGDYIKHIQGQVEQAEMQHTINFVYENLPLFLEDSDYESITNKIGKDSIDAITLNNYKTLIAPSGIIAKDFILKDPLGISFIALKKLQDLSFGEDFTLENGFLVSKDKSHILLFITPVLDASETSQNTQFVENLYATNSKLNTAFKGKVNSEYYGGTLIAVANANQIKKDIQLTVSIALTVLLLIFIVFYRKLTIPIILFIPTIFGGLLAIVILFLVREKISAISLGIGSVLLGVTLDYSLHILTHLRSHNHVKNLYKEISKPILMSSLTTALAFLCLLFINSQALQDLGLFTAISVMGSSIFALLFIPHVYKKSTKKVKKNTLLDKIASYNLHQKKWAIIGLVLLCIGSLFTYNSLKFNNDISQLNYLPDHLKSAELRLDKLINSSSKSIYIAAYGNSEEKTLQVNDAILKKLKTLKSNQDILNYSSVGTLVHSEKQQNHKIAKWHAFWDIETIENTKNNIIESGNTLGFKPKTFSAFYNLLDQDFNSLKSQDYKALKSISVDDYISTKDDFTTITTLVKVEDEATILEAFKNQDQVLLIDRKQINETFLGHLKSDFNKLIGYSLIAVLVLLFLFYKSFSLTLVTSLPICLTWLLTIGVMGLFHIEFNIFNIIISTFIFGLGIDYSIFITNGLLHEYRTGEKALTTHKTSILLSVITTILGVGVLIFAKHPALHSISLVSLIGILSAVLVAFTIQPLLFKLFIGSKNKRPVSLRVFLYSIVSFTYFGLGGLLLSLFSVTILRIIPLPKKTKMNWFHVLISKFMKSVLYTQLFLGKKVINLNQEDFKKQGIIIANHTSFLDILAIGMLHPKIIFLVNDWVYNSPVFGKAVQLAGFYPVSNGIDNGLDHLQKKVDQGYTLMAFPEGTRSKTHKIKRFHKGAFYLAEQFNLDIIPVLIHGNSEIIPKGESMIRDGQITLKILDRISPNDTRFGKNYSQRAKGIGAYFRSEFNNLRKEKEGPTYFHKILLDDYRYNGQALYKKVREDINTNKDNYQTILDAVGDKDSIAHISNDSGQLDFLLALHGVDRKIISYIENQNDRTLVKNSYITNTRHITCVESIEALVVNPANVLILNTSQIHDEAILKPFLNTVNQIILLKESRFLDISNMCNQGFQPSYQNNSVIILSKTVE
ncbi:MMPL family transporter [Tamlana sp. 2_MG-2023]|uniref:MMPL family transporter n=1 Tax=unclassified Tamlana TaxID=2614803 RepID=UPI0026E1B2B4|nr:MULTISPECIES: MMPL family transporter [unclassified Tamlana]MDO6761150.1 MMPL family transporter [Tamlana sp. 2_MG-2023]MDO6791517.1 MMPL family transporter [Tamlana sp. 1_MG-2023]